MKGKMCLLLIIIIVFSVNVYAQNPWDIVNDITKQADDAWKEAQKQAEEAQKQAQQAWENAQQQAQQYAQQAGQTVDDARKYAEQQVEQAQDAVNQASCDMHCTDHCSSGGSITSYRYYGGHCDDKGVCQYSSEPCRYGCENGYCKSPPKSEIPKEGNNNEGYQGEPKTSAVDDIYLGVLRIFPVYNPDNGQIQSFDSLMRDMVKEEGTMEGSDLDKDPVKTTYFMLFKDDYFYNTAKIIKTENGEWMSMREALHEAYKVNDVIRAKKEYGLAKEALKAGKKQEFETHMNNINKITEEINPNKESLTKVTGAVVTNSESNGFIQKVKLLFSKIKHFIVSIFKG